MIKKEILIPSIVGLVSTVSALMIGIEIGKKRYSPKLTSGEIYIDYTEDSSNPSMYLNNLDPKTFSNNSKFIILGLNHIRK